MRTLRVCSFASLVVMGGFFLAAVPAASAATMPAFSYTISNPLKGAAATYTFSFTTVTDVPVSPDIILEIVFPFGFTVNDIANVSVTVDGAPQTMDTGSAFLGSRLLFARITSMVPGGSHVVVAVANVINHSNAGSYAFQTNPYTADFNGNEYDSPASVDPIVILDSLPTYALSYVAGAHGSLTGTASQTVAQGANATAVTAVPATGYHFSSWSDASTTNPRTDRNVRAAATLTASFAIDTHTVAYAAGAGGSLSGTLSQVVDYASSTLPVLAVPDAGFAFSGWSDASAANPRTDSNVVGDLSVSAEFEVIPAEAEHAGSRHGGRSVQSQVANLASAGNTAAADALVAQWPQLFGAPSAGAPPGSAGGVRDLDLGMTGADVLALQKFLNANGALLAASGAGSAGKETDLFGALTQHALAAYQKTHGIAPAIGYFGPVTRAQMKAAGLSGIWW